MLLASPAFELSDSLDAPRCKYGPGGLPGWRSPLRFKGHRKRGLCAELLKLILRDVYDRRALRIDDAQGDGFRAGQNHPHLRGMVGGNREVARRNDDDL